MGETVTYDISAAQAIEGWMSDAELLWLAEQASKHTRIVEIGSWKGRSTYALAQHVSDGGVVIAVDHWRGQELTAEPTTLDHEIKAKGGDAIFVEFTRNIEPIAYKVSTVRMSSEEVATNWRANNEKFAKTAAKLTPDMVFLDGEHAYEGVSNDIALWAPLLAPGGLLCGHDWWHEGIKRAVKEAVKGYQVAPGTNIWWATV